MKIRRLSIMRLPGIQGSFPLENLGDGVHVVVGPNEVGKSSICRAMKTLLWSDQSARAVSAEATLDLDGESWHVERDGARHVWQKGGVESAAPPLPASHLQKCFFLELHDLLDASPNAAGDVASVIRRQMAGGFSLEDAGREAFSKIRGGSAKKARSEFEGVTSKIREAVQKQRSVAEDEARLEPLKQGIRAGEEAQARAGHYETALEVLTLLDQKDRVVQELAAMPESLAVLSGQALERLEATEADIEKHRERRGGFERAAEAAREKVAASRLEDPLAEAELAAWRERVDALLSLELQVATGRRELEACTTEVKQASRVLGAAPGVAADLDLQAGHELFVFLRAATEAELRRKTLDQRIKLLDKLLEEHEFSEADERQLESMERAVGSLRDWLRAPDPGASTTRSAGLPAPKWLAGIGLTLSIFGLGLGFAALPGWLFLAGAGLALLLVAWLLRPDPALAYAREAAEKSYPGEVADAPAWNVAAVTEQLREFEAEVVKLKAAQTRARDRAVERANFESDRAAELESEAREDGRRRELARKLGLEQVPPAAELVDTARSLDALRHARQREGAASGQVGELTKRYDLGLAALGQWLVAHGEAAPSDAASAKAGFDTLKDRHQSLVSARAAEKDAQRSLIAVAEDIQGAQQTRSKIFQDAALAEGDRVGLTQLLSQLETYGARQGQIAGLKTSIALSERKLSAAGETALLGREEVDLRREMADLAEKAERVGGLHHQIAAIVEGVKRAREGHELEDLLASQSEALDELKAKRDQAMEAAAGSFLLAAVKQEHETNQLPDVLKRARELFALFTHHAYELQVAPEGERSFVAVESSTGHGKRPEQLSGGTRAQLLLAARIAFAEEAEAGQRLPLFFDEALDQSDPARFHAIARSLGRIAEDQGRQIFYLTSDPNEIGRVQAALAEEQCAPAQIIDLGELRRGLASVASEEALRVESLPAVPDPESLSPEAFGASIRVPGFAPGDGHLAQHLIYLLWDDLPLLKRLLESRIERVGPWLSLSRDDAPLAAAIKAQAPAGTQLDARAQLLEAFCDAWIEGRGRPVDREAIEASDAISERFLDDVVDIAREFAGDAVRLIESLSERSDERLGGFRAKSVEKFQEFLQEEGYLDPRLVLEEPELVARALASPATRDLPGNVCNELLHRWFALAGDPVKSTGPA